MKTVRLDDYICIDIDKIIVDEMRDIIGSDCFSLCPEDDENWARLQEAAKVILENYSVGGK